MARGSLGSATIHLQLEYARVSKGIDQVNKKLGNFERSVKRMSNALTAGFTAVGVIQLGKSVVRTGLELKRMETALKSVTGSQMEADRAMKFVAETSDRLGINLLVAADGYAKLVASAKGTAVEGRETQELFLAIAESSRALGLAAEDTSGILRAFGQVMSKGKVQAEELRGQIGERLYGAFQKAAEAMGVTTADLDKMLEQGKVGLEIIPELTRVLRDDFSAAAEEAAKGPAAEFERFNNTLVEIGGVLARFLLPPLQVLSTTLRGVARAAEFVVEGFKNTETWSARSADRFGELAKKASEAGEAINEVTLASLKMQRMDIASKITEAEDVLRRLSKQAAEMTFWDFLNPLNTTKEALEAHKRLVAGLERQWLAVNDDIINFGKEGTEATGKVSAGVDDVTNAVIRSASVFDGLYTDAINEFTGAWEQFYRRLEGRYRASVDDMLDLWDSLREAVTGFGQDSKEAMDKAADAAFDMKEAMLNVQNNIQTGFSDLFYDLFSGKGVDSFKDFANRVFDIFKRLLADMAAAWAAAKIFNLPVNYSGGFTSMFGGGQGIGRYINGGGIGGGIGQGTGTGGISKAISTGLGKVATGLKGVFSGGGAAAGNGFGGGLAGGGGFATQAGGSSAGAGAAGWGWAAVPALIAAFGFSQISKKQKERAKRQQEFFSQVGFGTNEDLGESAWDFRGMLDDATAFFSTTREGWQSTVVALKEAGVAVQGWGASLDESGRGLVKIQGDIAGVKSALSGAVATGYDFVGSLSNAIEKGNSLRVSIQGDAEAIESALQAATAMGIGGFVGLEKTANGVSATLTGNIELWDKYLQGFVNEAINAAVHGVSALGGAAANATADFLTLANAASKVKVSGVTGGRSAQVDSLPKFADGGITSGPSIAGEAGPEAVIPLKNGKIPLEVNSDGFGEKIYREIRRQNRRTDYALGGR